MNPLASALLGVLFFGSGCHSLDVLTGHHNLGDLTIADLCTTRSEISNHTEVELV
jgi:hypothetical protein